MLEGSPALQLLLHCTRPLLRSPHSLAPETQYWLYQLGSLGICALQEPLHCIDPLFRCPQSLAPDWQELPYPLGFAGVPALQPLQPILPLLRCPQSLAPDWQELPYPLGFPGAAAPQVTPSQAVTPFVHPPQSLHELHATELQEEPQAGTMVPYLEERGDDMLTAEICFPCATCVLKYAPLMMHTATHIVPVHRYVFLRSGGRRIKYSI